MKQKRQIIKNYKKEKQSFQYRILFAGGIVALLMIFLTLRLAYLQIFQHKLYTTLSEKNYLELLPIEPNRGLLYDRNGVLLAENIPAFSLDLVPDRVPDIDQTITELQKIVNISDDDLKQFYKTLDRQPGFRAISLKVNLSENEVAQFYLNQYRFPGVKINAQMIRFYPLNKITASVVGYVGRINPQELADLDPINYSASNFIGKTGIEKYYEPQLHGTVGYTQIEVDASGHLVRTINTVSPSPGNNIYLSIDSKLQETAQNALGAEAGAIVAIVPNTGEILALVSNPSFDPNLFANGISSNDLKKLHEAADRPLYNRATRGQFPIASTIKPYIAIQGLDTGVITPDYTINDKGWFKLPNAKQVYRDWNWKVKGRGLVNVTKAIIVSSDPFFFNLAVLLGIGRIDDILYRFGFGQKTGIDMPEEASGVVSSPEWKRRVKGVAWYGGDTVNSGIGQGYMLATPLQLAYCVATLANRGLHWQPHFLIAQQTPDGKTINYQLQATNPIVLKNTKNWNIIIKAMQGVVTSVNPSGTARANFGYNTKYTVAAKTGTAQVYSKHGRNEDASTDVVAKKLRNHSLFIAFAPVDNPKIAIAVIVEHSTIAGKIARKILDSYLLPGTSDHAKSINKS